MSGIYPQDLISRWTYFFGGGGSGGGPAAGGTVGTGTGAAVPAGAGFLFLSFHFLTFIAFLSFLFPLANFLVSTKLVALSLIAFSKSLHNTTLLRQPGIFICSSRTDMLIVVYEKNAEIDVTTLNNQSLSFFSCHMCRKALFRVSVTFLLLGLIEIDICITILDYPLVITRITNMQTYSFHLGNLQKHHSDQTQPIFCSFSTATTKKESQQAVR